LHFDTTGPVAAPAQRAGAVIYKYLCARELPPIGSYRRKYMRKLLAFIGSTIGGYIGWYLGALVGFMTGFILSMVGTGFGMYFAYKMAQNYE
jgi:hypothetical protein